jgi:hypothetical protein
MDWRLAPIARSNAALVSLMADLDAIGPLDPAALRWGKE